ncbi:RlpA-like double-psi beta-barrel-protein domain-containing protein-containing protein [Syncephalis fuscata]|nr:RlpA-like double-psi beta-barrel-protein domain-containing protein-containing protein [Syncephalis fuscata]
MRVTFSALFLFSLAVIVSAKRHYPRAFQVNHFERRGIITYYTPSNDACTGKSSSSSDMVAALAKSDFGGDYGGNTEKSPTCGRCVEVTGPLGKVVVKIVDMCESCNSGHVDLSPVAFEKVAKKSAGKLTAQWKFVDCSGASSGGKTSEPAPVTEGKEAGDKGGDESGDKTDTAESDSSNKKNKGYGKKDSGSNKTEGDSTDSSESNSGSKDSSTGSSDSGNDGGNSGDSDSGKYNGGGKSGGKKSKGKKNKDKKQKQGGKNHDDSKKKSGSKKQKNDSKKSYGY